ncbi:DNA-3-methyladenine glycosylase 2 family protein [Altererythrobacter sp. SALINAS58]|uniref:DNA-3-methyladenine glycosylase family protein n=1 Tax=Alteripontixanthobacter muriae TaxID=2705546 RepID=UPI001576944D|nr:DNA-3-methyladenine glycosylase 2 family protein [Alteripontixanthobacter muriae]NTZ42199.1 DNA-3-methyladenine glycosylase 2 family protein [Alteripontixanthobacter muriae]
MGLSAERLKAGLDAIADKEPAMARALALAGYPQPRISSPGYRTLLRTIVGQQVSVAAAASVWGKLELELGAEMKPDDLLARDYDALRACGLSRQKQGYARSLCELLARGELDLEHLPADDEVAIAELTRIKGIGRWSAEIYLLFAEGREDIWPAGDLAVMAGIGKILGLPERPNERQTRALAEDWRPFRGSAAIFTWHYYSLGCVPV